MDFLFEFEPMTTDKFDTISVGDEAELFHTITPEDVGAFSRLTGDDNPLHVDKAYAAETTFGRPVVHGMLTASFLSTMIGTKLPGEGSLWYEQQTRFLSPVWIGETIRVWAKVRHKSPAQRVVVLETVVFGEDGRKVIEGEAKVKVIRQEKEKGAIMSSEQKGTVIVSGGSRGIGAAIAKALASDGYFVVINYLHSRDKAQQIENDIRDTGGRALAYQADVSDEAAVQKMVAHALAEHGPLAGIVNNASGPIVPIDFSQLVWDDIQQHINIQLKGAFNLTQAALPHLVTQKSGVILNIASIYADGVPPAKLLPYSMAKAALVAFAKSLAADYGPSGIRINCVSPGMTYTDLLTNVPEKTKMLAKMQTPLRRLGVPEDIAGIAAFLFSDKSSFITGQNIRVCGGIVME